MSGPALALTALIAMVLAFSAVYAAARRSGNAGLVDVAWSAGFSVVAALAAALGSGWPARRFLIAAMTAAWSLRLAVYLYGRVVGHAEDGRYVELKRRWGAQVNRKMFEFFQFQALLVVALSAPLLVAASNPAPGLHPPEWAAAALFAIALGGEAVADAQLARFKAAGGGPGRVCDVGLWRYSRHPNYFFEWLVWVSYFAFAAASPGGLWTLYCPALMLYFLFRVTGIPATEEQALRTKGDAYREYQRRTSAFVPWFPRP